MSLQGQALTLILRQYPIQEHGSSQASRWVMLRCRNIKKPCHYCCIRFYDMPLFDNASRFCLDKPSLSMRVCKFLALVVQRVDYQTHYPLIPEQSSLRKVVDVPEPHSVQRCLGLSMEAEIQTTSCESAGEPVQPMRRSAYCVIVVRARNRKNTQNTVGESK